MKITDKVDTPKSCFELEVEFMHGDADGTTYERIQYTELEEIEAAYAFFKACREEYKNGMGGCDDYSHMERYEEYQDLLHWDITSQQGNASVEQVKVYWYSETGAKWNVQP